MAQLVLDLTDDQLVRTLKVYGEQMRLGRDASPDELVAVLKAVLKDTVLAVENNRAMNTAASNLTPWE